MPDLLTHDPEGDGNPYDPVPWCRYPVLPTTDDTISVGVRSDADYESVVVEWDIGGVSGRATLDRVDDAWSGQIGPFATGGRYRFVAVSPGLPAAVASEWYPMPVAHWEAVAFTGLRAAESGLEIAGDGALLSITQAEGDQLDWALVAGSGEHQGSDPVVLGDWTASLEEGRVLIERADVAMLLGAEVCHTDGKQVAWRLKWRLGPEERIFGTGERFDALDQRGRTPDIRVYEQYKQQGARTYFPLPWLWSTAGYGLAIDGQARVSYDLGVHTPDEASATIPTTGRVSGRWYFGTPKEMLQAYVGDVGLPSPLPAWAYGPWMSGNEWNSDQRVREVVARTRSEDIPATVVVIEAWSDEATFYLFNDTEYDPVPGSAPVSVDKMTHGGKWPDPKGLVDWLHNQGVRVLLWQIPLLKETEGHQQQDADIAHADSAGLSVRTDRGEAYRNRGWWFPGARAIDFTNPEARRWWFDKRSYLVDDIGIDGFKTDGGEHLWGRDVTTYDGTTGDEAANAYPTHYLNSYHTFLKDHGHQYPLTFSRAGFTGAQSLPAHWAGDEDSTWDAFRGSLTAGLSAGASGVAFWGWDLAGFSGDLPSAELYKRATAMAAFCPIMQYHSEHNEHRLPLADRTPWNVADHTEDADVVEVYRYYARLRMNLVPYLQGLGCEAATSGLPLMRALALEYPDDPQAVGIDDQYLLGPDLLVAPVLSPGVTQRNVYLPGEDWRNLWTGEPAGAGWIAVSVPPNVIPVFVRAGACLPLWMPEDSVELGVTVGLPEAGSGRLVLMAFPGPAQQRGIDPVSGDPWTVRLTLDNETLTVSATGIPAGAALWIRSGGAEPERHISVPLGDSVTTIDVGNDAR